MNAIKDVLVTIRENRAENNNSQRNMLHKFSPVLHEIAFDWTNVTPFNQSAITVPRLYVYELYFIYGCQYSTSSYSRDRQLISV